MAAERPKIGKRIREAMERRRMNQQQLADAIGVARPTISNWVNDKAYPQNSIGALDYVLGTDLRAEADPLPDIVAANQHIPQVMAIWSIPDAQMPELQRLALIRMWLREHPPGPQTRPHTGEPRRRGSNS